MARHKVFYVGNYDLSDTRLKRKQLRHMVSGKPENRPPDINKSLRNTNQKILGTGVFSFPDYLYYLVKQTPACFN